MLAVGMVLGAFIATKRGWPMVWFAVVASVIDTIWGRSIGLALGEFTRFIFSP